jgi:hypothetical protein
MDKLQCCNDNKIVIFDNEYCCSNCGEILKKTVINYDKYDQKKMTMNSIKINNHNKIKNIYISESISYKQVKTQSLFTFLKQKNNKSTERIHENILESTVNEYVENTKNKIYRSNKRSECLALLLYQQCIKFNNPKTITFIINYMDLNKGGISRGVKALSIIKNNVSVPVEDNLIILNNYLDKLLTLTPKQLSSGESLYYITYKKCKNKNITDVPNITPNFNVYKKMVIKILNFIKRIGVFDEFRTITKIIGSIFLILKENKLKYNNNVFKQVKIEKNCIKNLYKKIADSIYHKYCRLIIDSYLNELIN